MTARRTYCHANLNEDAKSPMSLKITAAASPMFEQDTGTPGAHGGSVSPGEIVVGVVIGRTSEFFDFFVYAIASVVVFPKLVFPDLNAVTGTLYSFAIFALAFVARPVGTAIFMWVDRAYGCGAKLTIALFLLGSSTVAIAFLPGHEDIGRASALLLALFRICQGPGLGGPGGG